jgi:hypothetical protein
MPPNSSLNGIAVMPSEQFCWEDAVAIERLGHRRDFALREIGDRRLQLALIFGEIEVHSSFSLGRPSLPNACRLFFAACGRFGALAPARFS